MGKLKYTRNDNYFSKPTIENCYWAGFIAADGSIEKKSNRSAKLSIQLQQKDKEHLMLLCKALNYNGPLYNILRKRQNKVYWHSVFSLRSNKIISDLRRNFRITPNKTFTLKPPKLFNAFALSYIKGYIDGDGHIRKDDRHIIKIVSGSKQLLTWIKSKLDKIIVCDAHVTKKENIWQYQIEGKKVDVILDKLKNISSFALYRKWQKI